MKNTGSGIKSWKLTEKLWKRVRTFILQRTSNPNKVYHRGPEAGRKPLPARQMPEAIFFVLQTGIRWMALPKEYGAASSIHQHGIFFEVRILW
jgi:transposase